MRLLKNITRKSDFALVIDWEFHSKNRWVSAYSPYLVDALIKEFNPLIISSQREYALFSSKFKYVISFEPGWGAPKIKFAKGVHKTSIFLSDPHSKVSWLESYVEENNVDYVLSYYYHPFFHHLPSFDKTKFIHFPWSVPDQFVLDPRRLETRNQKKIHIFGGMNNDAYDTRRWCTNFDFVTVGGNSGVENKVMNDEEYYLSNRQYDAIIAAGSLSKYYQLVTPKYFEILAGGALLFAQYCEDLDLLGMNEDNCVIFEKENFEDLCSQYITDPISFLEKRKSGIELIHRKHTISQRMLQLSNLYNEENQTKNY